MPFETDQLKKTWSIYIYIYIQGTDTIVSLVKNEILRTPNGHSNGLTVAN